MLNGALHLSSSRVVRALRLAALPFTPLGAAPTTPQRRATPCASSTNLVSHHSTEVVMISRYALQVAAFGLFMGLATYCRRTF